MSCRVCHQPSLLARQLLTLAILLAAGTGGASKAADEVEEIEVTGRQVNLVGSATSASEGLISHDELQLRPLLRTGEVLETVPGLVATQHSGSGKANQYFLRGFNLDHGTDFATFVDDMPVNMRTHAHGQGYTDLNFLIPELLEDITYRKGSYYADAGDFSATGSARLSTSRHLEAPTLSIGAGQYGYERLLVTGSAPAGEGGFIYGVEAQGYSGPWDQIDENVHKTSLWLKYLQQSGNDRYSLTFMGYDNKWNSPDQIPERAVLSGLISEYGSIDTTVGGNSSRYSLSANWHRDLGQRGQLDASAYVIDYNMQLWSDFSYFTNPGGDQFQQLDDRFIYGGKLEWQRHSTLAGHDSTDTFGSQLRIDDIGKLGLTSTRDRVFTGDIRTDRVNESSLGLYWQNTVQWTPKLRSVVGARYDYYDFDVTALAAADPSTLAANSGHVNDGLATASAGLSYAVNDGIELYGNLGQGFHSNDARGVTIKRDPVTGDPVQSADPLVRTLGAEAGVRVFLTDRWNASAALWHLDIDSELVFAGDTGSTEDTGVGSRRDGIELTSYYRFNDLWSLDFEYSRTDARFKHPLDGSTDIPGSIPDVLSAGLDLHVNREFNAYLRLRYFSGYPLDEGHHADSSTLVNLRLIWNVTPKLSLSMDVLNLLNSDDKDVEYYYESQLQGESAPVGDRHFHVFEPRAVRGYLAYRF
ncbi:MAG TPA: TonB-dependent receptor [Candidatus Acidoferrum sp.]|nr:TonB-dependent receptor [Candidatus Acidoferrum sp.]